MLRRHGLKSPVGDVHLGATAVSPQLPGVATRYCPGVAGLVRVEYTKWDGARHWHFEVELLGADAHGTWFSGRPGIDLQRADEPPVTDVDGFVMLVPAEGDWIAFWNHLDEPAVYVDVTNSPVMDSDAVRAVDLDLDVIAWRAGGVEIVDRDEFEQHQVALGYPSEVVAGAEKTALWLESRMREGRAPFDATGPAWLDRAAASWEEPAAHDG